MNLSFDVKKMMNKQYQLTARERMLVIVAIGVITLYVTMYATSSEVAVEPTVPNSNSQQAANISNQSVAPTTGQVAQIKQVDQTIRDPFAKLPEVQEQKKESNTNVPTIPNNIPLPVLSNTPVVVQKSNVIPHGNFKLTGIVGSSNQRLAVIMFGGKSQSYSLNEVIGTYKLVGIHQDSIVLQNASEKIVLQIEAAGQKGDNNSAK